VDAADGTQKTETLIDAGGTEFGDEVLDMSSTIGDGRRLINLVAQLPESICGVQARVCITEEVSGSPGLRAVQPDVHRRVGDREVVQPGSRDELVAKVRLTACGYQVNGLGIVCVPMTNPRQPLQESLQDFTPFVRAVHPGTRVDASIRKAVVRWEEPLRQLVVPHGEGRTDRHVHV
jgi:hypothetical protein